MNIMTTIKDKVAKDLNVSDWDTLLEKFEDGIRVGVLHNMSFEEVMDMVVLEYANTKPPYLLPRSDVWKKIDEYWDSLEEEDKTTLDILAEKAFETFSTIDKRNYDKESYVKGFIEAFTQALAQEKKMIDALYRAKSMLDHIFKTDGTNKLCPLCDGSGAIPTKDGADQCQWCAEYEVVERAITNLEKITLNTIYP